MTLHIYSALSARVRSLSLFLAKLTLSVLIVLANAEVLVAGDTDFSPKMPSEKISSRLESKHEAQGPYLDQTSVAKVMGEGFLAARVEGGKLEKGTLFSISSIQIRSVPNFTSDQMGLVGYMGAPATAGNLHGLSEKVRAYLLNHGHPFAVVSFDFATRPDQAKLELTVFIEAGAGFKYGGFKYSGSRILPEALERLSLLKYGETFNESRLSQAQAKLARTGYFEALIPGILYRDSTRNLIYPSLSLSDFKGNRLSGILGYDSERNRGSGSNASSSGHGSGVNGYLDIHLINLRGTARDLDFNFESQQVGAGTDSREAKLVYTEPWILGTSVGVKFNAQITLEDSVYDEGGYGLEFFQDLDFNSRYMVALSRQFNHDYLARSHSTAEIAGLGFQYDARDQVPATRKGLHLSLRLNGLHRNLDDSSYFLVQNIHEIALWGSLGRWVAHSRIVGSGNWPLGDKTNRGELFAIGGANSIRGFREKEFLTNLILYGNFEIQFILAPRSRASIFMVPAFINRLHGDVDWKREIGYGVGLDSGAKDWTFGISYALNPERSFGNGFVHMRVTNNF